MINKKFGLFLFIVCTVSVYSNLHAQVGYVIFGSPTSTGCSGTGMCQVQAMPFQSMIDANTMAPTNATRVLFSSIYDENLGTYVVSMAINLNELHANQPTQDAFFRGPNISYSLGGDVFIPTNIVGGPMRADYTDGIMHIERNSTVPFASQGANVVILSFSSGLTKAVIPQKIANAPAPGGVTFDIQSNVPTKTTFPKNKNKHKHRHKKQHRKAERRRLKTTL